MQWITVIELESQQSLYFFQYDTCSFESKIPFSFAVYHLNFHSLTTAFLKSDYVAKLIQKDNFKSTYSNTSQTRGSKLAKFSNSRFLLLFFTSKLAVIYVAPKLAILVIF